MPANVNKRARFEYCFEREGGRCFYCDRAVVQYGASWPYRPDMATLDHIIPRAHGGGNDRNNTVLACRECNEARDLMPAEQFLAHKMGQANSRAA